MKRWKGFVRWFKSILQPFGLLRENIRSLIGFEVIFRLLTFVVIFPLMTWAQRLWLVANNTKVIAWYNASKFVRNPISWIIFIFMLVLLVSAAMFEQFAIYDTLHASKFRIRRTTRQIFSAGFDMYVERLKPENWGFLPYVIFVLRFGSISGDVSSITSVIRIPGFILEDFTKHTWEMVAYNVFQFLALFFFLRWLFAIPIMMEEDGTSFTTACRKSAAMTGGRYMFRVFFLTVCWRALIGISYMVGSVVAVAGWYLLSIWVIPAETAPFIEFFQERIFPTSVVCYIISLWIVFPMIAATFQAAYYKRKEELGDPLLRYTDPPHFFHRYPILKVMIVALCAVCIFFSVAPENTMPAFEKCLDEGFTAAELDVQLLKDGTLIVMHDDNLARTTGVDKNVWEVTYDEIKDLDNGTFFDEEYAGTKIPTLDEVLKLAGSGKDKLFLNIEIKRNGHDEGITQKVVETILENDYLSNCDITSQDYSTLEEVRKINPSVLTAYTSAIGIGNIDSLEAADIISIQETFATYENIERIHNAGKHVFVWTVNEQDTMEHLVSLNVDAILTNDPQLCKVVIDNHDSSIMNVLYRLQEVFTFL